MADAPQHCAVSVSVQKEDFDLGREYQALRESADNPGAIAVFSGLVREVLGDAGQQSLTLEHYPGMTEKSLATIIEQACQRWPVSACRVIHRVGELLPGEQIVLVMVASAHRDAAFASAEFIMDYLKTSAPFWKKQKNAGQSDWVASRAQDYERAARWQDTDKT